MVDTNETLDHDDLEKLQEHVRRLRPLNPSLNSTPTSSTRTPRDSSLGAWGRPKGNRHGPTWVDTNCLRASIGTLLQRDISAVPDPTPLFRSHGDDWREAYDKRLKAALGVRLEEIPAGGCPPIGHVKWIACLRAGEVNHAVLAHDGLVFHDPNSNELGGLPVPRDRLVFGLRLVAADAPLRDRWGAPIR